VYFEMGQPQGIAPTQCHVGAIPLDEPFALKYRFICASVLIDFNISKTQNWREQ